MKTEQPYIRYKGKGEHSVNELEKIIEQREEELHLLRSGKAVNMHDELVKQIEKLNGLLESNKYYMESLDRKDTLELLKQAEQK